MKKLWICSKSRLIILFVKINKKYLKLSAINVILNYSAVKRYNKDKLRRVSKKKSAEGVRSYCC